MNEDGKAFGTEGIVATPAQQKVALDNKTYNGDPIQTRIAAYHPENNKEAENTAFNQNKAWRSFLIDPLRNVKPNPPKDYRTFRQLETMWRKPEYASIIDAHGSDMAVGGQLLSDFVDWDKVSWWDKQVIGIGAARRGMQIGELRTAIAEMQHNGEDPARIDALKAELAKEEEYARSNTRPYDSETANAFASFGVSFARVVPEMVITSAALAAALPTGGATAAAATTNAARIAMTLGNAVSKGSRAANIIKGLKAARAVGKGAKYIAGATDIATAGIKGLAEAGIVYNDTYRVTMGDLYKRIQEENPGMTEEQVYDLADTSAQIQAIMEAVPALVGLGARAATTAELDVIVKSVLSKVPKEQIKKAAFMRAFEQGTNKEIMKRIAAGWTKDAIVDTLTEVAQTAAENATMEIAENGGDGGQVLSNTFERMAGLLIDPLNEKYSDELNTLLTTLPAAFVFGGIGPGIALTGRAMSKNRIGTKLSDTFNNFRFGAQMRAYTQDAMSKGVAPEAIKEQIRGMASRGDAPGSVYFDKTAVQELADTDPEFRRAMDKLGVLKQLAESEGNGGVVEVDLADYNELVNGEQSGVLYQKVKDMVSFKLDSMSMSQLNEWIASTQVQNKKEIQKAIEDEKSVYNRTLKEFLDDPMFAAMTEEQRKANATLMQLVANRAVQSIAEPMTAEEWFEKNVLLTKDKGESVAQAGLFDEQGNMRSDVWQQISDVFGPEKMAEQFANQDGSATQSFGDLLKATLGTPDAINREFSQPAISDMAEKYGITPEQFNKALDIARGTQEQGRADTSVSTEGQTEEQIATDEIVTGTSATGAEPANIIFDINSKESTFENNYKKNGEIKENTKRAINQLFTTRDLAETGGMLSELYSLISTKNSKWIKNNVSSVEIVDFANKYDVSPTQIYRAVNIARGKPEALAPVVMPTKVLSNDERSRIIDYFIENNQGRGIDEYLKNLSDYELKLLYALDPRYLWVYNGTRLAAKISNGNSIYVEKNSLEKSYSSWFGGVSYSFGRSTVGTYHLWGSVGGKKDTTIVDFASKEEMEKYRDEHNITDVTNTVISILTGRIESNLKALDEGISREGKDYRNGRDVTTEEIENRFGFRTIGLFGLLNKQEQNFLNSIYDSFSTLADLLNIPYSAISLSGTLGITTNFGTHRTSSAWYDPDKHTMDFVVTKEKISKAVAHEWWHALDNYLARGSTESLNYSWAYATQRNTWDLRVETRDAMIALMDLRKRVPGFVKRTANAPHNPAYWSQGTERGARMFEQYVAVKLQEKGEHDKLLTDDPSTYANDGMYLTTDEQKKMSPYFDNLFKVLKTEQTASGKTRLFQSAYAGSRVDYDKPSLEAIGSGEGNQAHGWGLYYALNQDIAEKYWQDFTRGLRHVNLYNGEEIDILDTSTPYKEVLVDFDREYDTTTNPNKHEIKERLQKKYQDSIDYHKDFLKTEKDLNERAREYCEHIIRNNEQKLKELNKIDPKLFNVKNWGQVVEADIPEANYLLDEQESFSNQSPYVKKALERMLYDDAFKKFHETDAEDFAEVELTDWELGFTGGNIYDRISNLLDSDKAASQLMEKYGIKGITYDGQQDGRCFVIFNPDDVKVLRKKFDELGNVLFQKTTGEKIAGWFDVIDGRYVVNLTKDWNATTFSHEVFHLYSRVLQDNYNNGTMTSYWKAQAEKLFKSVDAVPNENGEINLTKNQEELLAERFTTYLLENEIKNPELNSIFALLRDAFRKTYKQFNMVAHHPDAKTKEAFAVIFGAQDVAIAEQRAMGLVEIEKPEGVSQEAYDHYMSFLMESRAKATHDMIKTFYRVEKYKTSKEYAKAYDEEYTRNLKAVEQQTTFQIKALAKQLNTTEIPAIMLAYNSTHGDALITEDDVVSALNNTDEATKVAEGLTADYMNDLIKQKFNIKDDQTLVSKDAKNVALAKAFLMESLMNEGKDWADFNDEYTRLLDVVENQIQKMPLSKLLNTRRWSQLESVYAQQYQMYSSLGNKEKIALVRRQQAQVVLIQNKMFEMNNRVDRFIEKFPKKLRNAQPQGQNTMSAESWDLLQSLMEQYGFKISDRRRGTEAFNIKLENWLSNIEESEFCPISNIRYFMPETVQGHTGPFTAMTVRQFEVLEHMAIAINSIASREYYLITEDEKQRYDALAMATAERLQKKGIKPYDENDTWMRKHLGVLSNIVNPEPILKALFPEEVQRMLIRPFFSAAAEAESKFNDWNDRWNNLTKGVNLSNTKKKYSTGHVLSYNNVANLLLAMGTEHAYENWRLFLKVDEAQAETIVAEAIAEQPALVDFANKYWAMMAETTEVMNDSYRQRYNKLFVKKEPRTFKIGEHEFTGGYVPETKLVSELSDDAGWESIIMGELSNEKLINDKPDGQDLQSIVDHTRSRLRLFARWGYVAPAFNNFVRFVQRDDVGAAIGSRAQNYIRGWLRDYHTPVGDSAGLMHALMSATTTTVLGLRLPQALLQLSGLIPAMGILGRGGIRYVTSALGRTLREGGFHQVALASRKSAYMKARYSDPVKTLFGVSKTEAKISETMGKFQKLAMSMISYMDAIVSNATWEASYRMALDNGMTEIEAIEKADQDVRLSQTDALTLSRSRAMKSDWARIITPFSTYMMGMQSVVRGKIAEKDFYGAATFALCFTAISTMFEAMMKEIPMPWDQDDDENYLEKIKKRWYNDTVSTLGSTLYPIAGIGSYATESFAQGLEKVINPDEPTLIDMYGMGSLSALNYAKQYPDAFRYGLIGIFNGDEDAQRKAVANFVGWFSAGGKRMVKDLMED